MDLSCFLGSWGNANVNYSFDLIITPFGRTNVIGEFLYVVCSWGLLVKLVLI